MREIDINDFYMSININQGHNIVMLIKIQKSEKDETQSLFFQLKQQTFWLVFLLIIIVITNSNKLLLFCFIFSEYFTWLFNCSLWVRYSSLGTHYYFWQRGALAIKSHHKGIRNTPIFRFCVATRNKFLLLWNPRNWIMTNEEVVTNCRFAIIQVGCLVWIAEVSDGERGRGTKMETMRGGTS